MTVSIELNTRFVYTPATSQIDQAGITAILRLIQVQNPRSGDWQKLNPVYWGYSLPALPEDWQWTWLVTGREEYTGTFPKRLAHFYHKVHGLKCPTSFLSEIGNIARAHNNAQVSYHFEFVNRFDWQAGDYGDDSSCYWSSHAGARLMLEDNGGLAVRFYNAPDSDQGIARAWFVPFSPNGIDEFFVLFNGYGFAGDATRQIAQIIANYFGLSYRKIELSNEGRTVGSLYINGGMGYIIGEPNKVNRRDRYDFGWEEIWAAPCPECGELIREDEGYPGPDDNTYCEYCHSNLFSSCDRCGEVHWNADVEFFEDPDEYLCQFCAEHRRDEESANSKNEDDYLMG